MNQFQRPYRLFPCGFSLLVALGSLLLILNHLQVEQMEARSSEQQTANFALYWFEFPVITSTARSINVHRDYILWSAYLPFANSNCEDYEPYPPPNNKQPPNLPQEDYWSICLYRISNNSFLILNSGTDLIYPDMYGNWVVMDRNYYNGTLRAENTLTGEKRDIWTKSYEERTPPHIYEDTVVSSPDNKSLIAYNLVTESFTNITFIPDYPDTRSLSGYVYENIVVWKQATNADYDFDIMGFNLTTQTTFTVTDLSGDEFVIGLENQDVYWVREGIIYRLNLETDEEWQLDPVGNLGSIEVSGDWIVWTDDRHGAPTLWDIYAYNMTTQQEYRLTSTSQPIFDLGFDGTLVAWITGGDGSPYGTQIKAIQLLPYSAFLPLLQR